MKKELTIKDLIESARAFCERESEINHESLVGVTDGKAIGTYVEHRFQDYLEEHFAIVKGSSAKGIDLPQPSINTDIKVTSIKQPQSSCPFRNAWQKIYGLGYNLILFVYEKKDLSGASRLIFHHCAFIKNERTADYTLTKRLLQMISDGANEEDIAAYLHDRYLPCGEDEIVMLSRHILQNPPMQGYLTISNALQWRLQYGRVLSLLDSIDGIVSFSRENGSK